MSWLTNVFILMLANWFCVSANWLIINGTDAGRYEFPQMVAIILYNTLSCGGTLINGNTVLTAAHCVYELKDWSSDDFGNEIMKVIIGDNDLDTKDGYEKEFKITRVICHSSYSEINDTHSGVDMALVKFDGFISNTQYPHIKYTLLDTDAIPKLGRQCQVLGWGRQQADVWGRSRYLQKAFLTVISNDECYGIYGDYIKSYHICAGSGPLSTSICNGDSGGPLLCTDSFNRQIQVGINIAIGECGQPYTPGIFMRIYKVANWILNNAV